MNISTLKQSTIQAILHAVVWFGFQYLVLFLFKVSNSIDDFATISGWFAAVIFGYLWGISFKALLPISAFYFVAAFVDFYAKTGFFYEDIPETVSVELVILLFSGFLLFVSPIIINQLVRFVIAKIRN